jgi:hypothetical protein
MEISVNAEYLKRTRDPDVVRTPEECMRICRECRPVLTEIGPGHEVACHRYGEGGRA